MSLPRETPASQTRGILLVGHGTHHASGSRQFLALAGLVAEKLAPMPLEPAFLEIQSPTIADGVRRLIARGVRHVTVAPALLLAAGHAKKDVPNAVRAAVGNADGITIEQAGHFSCQSDILELSRRVYEQTLAGQGSVPREQTCLVMVGRGSRDAEATAEMHEFARRRSQQAGTAATAVGFIAMALPGLAEVLQQVAAREYRRVVVQPHLLFAGDMQRSIARQVASVAEKHPEQQWLLTPVLGDDLLSGGDAAELLPAAVIALIEKALAS